MLVKKVLATPGLRLKVIVTESNVPDNGRRVVRTLRGLGVQAALIPDAAVGHIIDQVDMVLVGAEAVTLSGGIINQVILLGCFYENCTPTEC